jgi:Arc/MetJ-type ribon-helix-helix transcriptional regulator
VLSTSKQKQDVPDQKSLRDELLGTFEREKHGLKNREISVMTRMSVDIVEILDALVELEIFKSRSEAVAAFVERSVVSRMDLFQEIRNQAKDIVKKREAAKNLAFKAIQSGGK